MAETESEPRLPHDFDMVEMPVEGVATYFLTIHKLAALNKKSARVVEDEAAAVQEPYVRHIMDLAFATQFPDEEIHDLAKVKRDILLTDLRDKLELMRIALIGISSAENPRKTLIKMLSRFPLPPLGESKAVRLANDMATGLTSGALDPAVVLNVDHKVKMDQLICKLLYYAGFARRESAAACRPYLPHIRSIYFADGLALIIDSFETEFIRRRLKIQKERICREAALKMDLALKLCLGLRNKLSYEDLFRIAKSYML